MHRNVLALVLLALLVSGIAAGHTIQDDPAHNTSHEDTGEVSALQQEYGGTATLVGIALFVGILAFAALSIWYRRVGE